MKTYNTPTTTAIEPITVIANIIQEEMGLTNNQIAFAYQNFHIPSDGLFVVLGYLGPSTTIANQGYFNSTLLQEVQEVTMRHMIQIDLMSISPDNSARLRKEEVLLALRSFYSREQQEANLMGIAWIESDIVDATALEETSMLNRYSTSVSMTALHRKVKAAAYLDVFEVSNTVASAHGSQTTTFNPAINPVRGK